MKKAGLWGRRVMLMTRMASFEANEGKQAIRICNFFRSDYVTLHVVRSAVSATIAFFLLGGLYIYYNVDMLLQEIYSMDLIETGRTLVTAYIIFVGTFALISYVVYSFRYDRARKSLKDYNNALRILSEMADSEHR
ncbi:MAG: hypothetical protein K6F35_00580 [Lachnospiraceae bacterium]|nr:hypothetical protein [Lachnospiraceae bacterium]